MSVSDSSPSALSVQLRVQGALTGEQRILLAFEMSMFARELAAAGIRNDDSAWSDADVSRELWGVRFSPGWSRPLCDERR